MDLTGKVALVTGAASGIGAATARRFVADGAKVCLNDVNGELLKKTVDSLPADSVLACPGDVSIVEDVQRLVETTLSRWEKINILVNSAGIDPPDPAGKMDLDLWHRILEVNLTGPYITMKTIIPHIVKAGGGAVVNIASLAGVRFFPRKTEYSSSKGGLIALTQQAAVEFGPSNVRCNVICPGGIRTPMMESHVRPLAEKLGKDMEWVLTQFPSYAPLGRIGKPEEVASICSFLVSEDSSLITGSVILADGGAAIVDINATAMKQVRMELDSSNG